MAEDGALPVELLEEYYPALRKLAAAQLRGHYNISVQPTEFIHELYLKLQGSGSQVSRHALSEQHFVALAARMLRQILNDHLRRKLRQKRGAHAQVADITLSQIGDAAAREQVDFIAFDRGLSELENLDPVAVQVVELKVFGGFATHEIAGLLSIGSATVTRKWSMAKGYMKQFV